MTELVMLCRRLIQCIEEVMVCSLNVHQVSRSIFTVPASTASHQVQEEYSYRGNLFSITTCQLSIKQDVTVSLA